MRTMSAKEAKNHFGELLMEAQKAPVTIEKNGKPVAVLYSMEWHEAAEDAKREWVRNAIAEGRQAIENGEYVDFASAAEMRAFFDDVKARGRRRLNKAKG